MTPTEYRLCFAYARLYQGMCMLKRGQDIDFTKAGRALALRLLKHLRTVLRLQDETGVELLAPEALLFWEDQLLVHLRTFKPRKKLNP